MQQKKENNLPILILRLKNSSLSKKRTKYRNRLYFL